MEQRTRERSPVFGLYEDIKSQVEREPRETCLQLCHQCLDRMEKFTRCWMRDLLVVQVLLESQYVFVELSRSDHRPRYDIHLSPVEARDEVVLIILHNPPKLEPKPMNRNTD